MYLLDTCTLSNYYSDDAQTVKRVKSVPRSRLFICAINVQELLSGPLSAINQENKPTKQGGSAANKRVIFEYARLLWYLEELKKFQILPYDEQADEVFRSMPSQAKTVSFNDRRIAAIAIARKLIVVTGNRQHFEKLLPEEQIEDWSRGD